MKNLKKNRLGITGLYYNTMAYVSLVNTETNNNNNRRTYRHKGYNIIISFT